MSIQYGRHASSSYPRPKQTKPEFLCASGLPLPCYSSGTMKLVRLTILTPWSAPRRAECRTALTLPLEVMTSLIFLWARR